MSGDNPGNNENGSRKDDSVFYGDVVEHIMNVNVFGVVIGLEGSLVSVRLSPSLVVAKFHQYELQHVDDGDYEPPVEDEEDNVIDFTKAVDLRNAKTKGAA